MKPVRAVAALRELRSQPLWQLLAADKGVVTIALLHHLLLDGDKVLPASVLYERLGRALDELRASGEDLPQTAQGYAADWLGKGWLTRRLAAGAHEEDFEISAEAAAAVRYVTSLLKRRTLATESRLALVQQQVLELAEKTDTNPATRVAALLAERERLDRRSKRCGDAGQTFAAFWRLLTDPEQSEALREALEAVVSRPFAKRLESRERKFTGAGACSVGASARGRFAIRYEGGVTRRMLESTLRHSMDPCRHAAI